jgi:hypothetical protein
VDLSVLSLYSVLPRSVLFHCLYVILFVFMQFHLQLVTFVFLSNYHQSHQGFFVVQLSVFLGDINIFYCSSKQKDQAWQTGTLAVSYCM